MFALSGNCTLPNSVTYHVNVPERIFPRGRRVFSNKSPVNSSKRWTMGYIQLLKKKERKGKERKGKEASLAKVARFRIAYAISRNSWHGQEIPQELCVSAEFFLRLLSAIFASQGYYKSTVDEERVESSRKRIKYGTGTPTWRRKWPFPRKMGLRAVF